MSLPDHQCSFEEAFPLISCEKNKLFTRNHWDAFIASSPIPALWVSAHVDISQWRPQYAALAQLLEVDLKVSRSKESVANAYRVFLQKFITQLNRKVLRSRCSTDTFRFLGSLERNAAAPDGRHLHYHFFLWEPRGLFTHNTGALQTTAETLNSLWRQKVNDKESTRCKPIDIQIVGTREDANRVARYTNKSNNHIESYELLDDWSTSEIHQSDLAK